MFVDRHMLNTQNNAKKNLKENTYIFFINKKIDF